MAVREHETGQQFCIGHLNGQAGWKLVNGCQSSSGRLVILRAAARAG
jgi:hypothetical protein